MTRAVAVIQARLGSRRFPQKMLADLGGYSMLEWVVKRMQCTTLVDRLVVATTQEPLDDRLFAECVRLGVEVVRGSTDDVLQRFVDAVDAETSDQVVRICADNPFIDPGCVDDLVREHRETSAEYAFNHRPGNGCDYADGFGAELITRELLTRLNGMQLSTEQREHVTLAVVDGTVAARKHAVRAPGALARPELSFDVDVPSDLDRLRILVERGPITVTTTAAEIISIRDELETT